MAGENDLRISDLQPIQQLALDTIFAVVAKGASETQSATIEQLVAFISGGMDFFMEAGDPIAAKGKNKDVYLNIATGAFFKKEGTDWRFKFTAGSGGGGGNFPDGFINTAQFVNLPAGQQLGGKPIVDALVIAMTAPFKMAIPNISVTTPIEKGKQNNITVSGGINLGDEPANGITNKVIEKAGIAWNNEPATPFSLPDVITGTTTYTFKANTSKGPISASATAQAFAPSYYSSTAMQDVTEAVAITGEKQIWGPQGSRVITFYNNNSKPWLVEPKTNGRRNRILDQNGFNVTNAFSVSELDITLEDGTEETYYLYLKKEPAGNGAAFVYTFFLN